jgi:catechol 2,3-dioxygenase-like lactoylglutathione lyase family enzyme
MTEALEHEHRVVPRDPGRIVPLRLAHFVIRTNRVKELVGWYKAVFEAETVFQNDELAFLYFDSEHHRLAIASFPGLEAPNPKAAGIDHVAFAYADIGDLLETYARLKRSGIEPVVKIDHGPTTSLYYQDPDGNQIELQVDNFDTLAEAHAYFRSEAFLHNPLGVEIDPDDLHARLRAGESPRQLLSAGTRPPRRA